MPRKYSPLVVCTCHQCHKQFTKHQHRVDAGEGKYCSQTCYKIAQGLRVQRICEHCGITFSVKPGRAATARFCSRACYHTGTRRSAADRFWEKVDTSRECWEWTGSKRPLGYGQMGIPGTNRPVGAHRISWELHFGPIPDDMFVCHRCDNPKCVRPDHLFLGTPTDNVRDMVAKGRHKTPFRHSPAPGQPGATGNDN